MNKEQLIKQINEAFKDVKLEEGVGIWEAQGLDNYANEQTLIILKKKDENFKNDWSKIPFNDLDDCYSSLSFLDAKGMRYYLPQYLIFYLNEDEIAKNQNIEAPDVAFTLSYDLEDQYQTERFSLLNEKQIECIISFLTYKLEKSDVNYEAEYENLALKNALNLWKTKL